MKKIKLFLMLFAFLFCTGIGVANAKPASINYKIEKVEKVTNRVVITTVTTIDTFAVYGPQGEIMYWLTVTTTVTTTVTYP